MIRVILEGGESDTQRLELDGEEPPAQVERPDGERYGPVLDHWDRHMRDITGRWRYRIRVEHRDMPRGYEAPRVKP
jgi:hypothetical protein